MTVHFGRCTQLFTIKTIFRFRRHPVYRHWRSLPLVRESTTLICDSGSKLARSALLIPFKHHFISTFLSKTPQWYSILCFKMPRCINNYIIYLDKNVEENLHRECLFFINCMIQSLYSSLRVQWGRKCSLQSSSWSVRYNLHFKIKIAQLQSQLKIKTIWCWINVP